MIACIFLFIGMLSSWNSLLAKSKEQSFSLNGINISQLCILFSNFLFGLTLLLRWIKESYFPLSNLYESLIFLSWCISSIQLFLEYKTKSRLISCVITPIVFFIASFSSLTLPIEMQKALPLVPSLQSNWLMMHVSMMMLSYGTLLIGSLLSIFYCCFDFFSNFSSNNTSANKESKTSEFQSMIILEKKNNAKISLLEIIDTWSYRIIGLGFPFLTLGIISGAVWANEAWGSYWSWDPKETWALITWLVFASYLHSRILKGWQGKKAASVGSLGFFVIWICYLGVNFLSKGLHTYGWLSS
jgi:cytochrome c-type biogenesis protein CcsB